MQLLLAEAEHVSSSLQGFQTECFLDAVDLLNNLHCNLELDATIQGVCPHVQSICSGHDLRVN